MEFWKTSPQMWLRHDLWELPSLPIAQVWMVGFPLSHRPQQWWACIRESLQGLLGPRRKEKVDEVMSAISSYLLTPSAWSFGADKSPGGEARKCMVEGRPHEGIGKKAPSPMIFLPSLSFFKTEVYWHMGFPSGSAVNELPAVQETCRRRGFNPGQEDALNQGTATHSSILVWKIPWTEEPCGLPSMGSQTVRHNWATKQQYWHIRLY